MTKSKGKRNRPTLEDLLERPWCFYCNKDFDDLKILVDHQKAKHYKCQVAYCNRRLNTVGGLRVHMQQVHKEELKSVPNALDDRDDVNLEIFGMEGIPAQMRQAYNQQVTQAYYKQEAEHRARTGNNLHSSGDQPAAKKPKFDEDARAELKRRVAEAKAKKEAQKAAAAAGLPIPADTSSPAPPSTNSPLPGSASNGTPVVEQQLPVHPQVSPVPQMPPYQAPSVPYPGAYVPPGMSVPPGLPGYAPPFHPLPNAVSPPGWGLPASLPPPPGGIAPPAHYHPYPPQPGINGLPGQYPNQFSPPPVAHALPAHLPARLPPQPSPAASYVPPNVELNKYAVPPLRDLPNSMLMPAIRLMDEQSKIALERLNGKDVSAEPAEQQQVAALPPKPQIPEKPTDKAAEKPSKASKKKQPTRLVLSDNEVSWEERRAALTKYQKPLVTGTQTVVGSATDNATGSVDQGVAVS